MADLVPIENYLPTNWQNYIPPSIDQDHLNHLEDNVKLNRDTINEIIRRLGIKPADVGADSDIYDNAIYDTLRTFKAELARLENAKLDKSVYNNHLGDMTKLKGGSTLVDAINNRLRRDIDDSADHTYTFKKLILTNPNSVGLSVAGSATIGQTLTVAGITSSGKVTVTHADGIATTKLTASKAVTFAETLGVTGKITGSGGLTITNGGKITGTLEVDNLRVTGNITCDGNITSAKTVQGKDVNGTSTVTAKNATVSDGLTINGSNNGDLWVKKNSILLGGSAEHRLWIQGANVSLRNGDALIRTVG